MSRWRLLEPTGCIPPQKLRQTIAGNSPVTPPRWQPDLNQTASTNSGAVHSGWPSQTIKSANLIEAESTTRSPVPLATSVREGESSARCDAVVAQALDGNTRPQCTEAQQQPHHSYL